MDIAVFTFVSKEHTPLFTTAMKGLLIVLCESSHNKLLSVNKTTLPDTLKGKWEKMATWHAVSFLKEEEANVHSALY
jgi:hypothetical protein